MNKNNILSGIGLNVLSLFDGISCGMIALERAGIKVNKYYASEIDESAIEVSKNNYPNIIQLGDVNGWKKWNIEWDKIDLLIGGSPCQGFSIAGKMLNFNDERSKLFFVYAEILSFIKTKNPNVKFLLENVYMKEEWRNVINEHLGVECVRVNSSLLSAARRDRLYWTNFHFDLPKDKNITFDDICDGSNEWLSDEYINKVKNWKAQQDPIKGATIIGKGMKLPCLTARGYNQSHSGMILITDGEKYRYLTNVEAERAMTLPQNYTSCLPNAKRAKAIGNGWTVDVITYIFKNL